MNELRCVQRKLEGDRATEGVSDNVRAPHAEIRQQPATVAGLLRETRCSPRAAAPAVTATVIADEPIAVGQAPLPQQRPEHVGDECAVDEDHRLACAAVLVVQRDAVDDRSSHRASLPFYRGSHLLPRFPRWAATAEPRMAPGYLLWHIFCATMAHMAQVAAARPVP